MNTGILYVVSTPIGNISDITLRAITILDSVDRIASEDTREIQKLLNEHGIETPTVSYHAQSPQKREDELVEELLSGAAIALVSDRGTPGISDPGSRLIRRAVQQGIRVVPIPGATAFVAAIQAAGVSTTAFSFLGFIPHKKGRQTFLKNALERQETVVWYESPHRIIKCLRQLDEAGAETREVVVARELTKQYEQFLRGTAREIANELESRDSVKGEFVVILNAAA